MDELTFGDKTYVSSKKAAKLTGYAKDYVGQLCREGKVEARLVGRNWYVLEDSIMSHRFGEESGVGQEPPVVQTEIEEEKAKERVWESPKYTPERVESLPEAVFVQPKVPEDNNTVPLNTVSDMQYAWQEWFQSRRLEPDTPIQPQPSVSDQNLQNPGHAEHETYFNTSPIDEFLHDDPEPVEQFEVPIVRKHEENDSFSRNYEEIAPSQVHIQRHEESISAVKKESEPRIVRKNANPRREFTGRRHLRPTSIAVFCVAGLIVAITYLAVSSIPKSEEGSGNKIIDYLNGVSSVN